VRSRSNSASSRQGQGDLGRFAKNSAGSRKRGRGIGAMMRAIAKPWESNMSLRSHFPILALVAALSVSGPLLAAEGLQLMFGAPDGEHATLTFSSDTASAEAILVETRLVGAAGSRLSLSVDRAGDKLFDRILTETDCRFVDQASTCRVSIAGGTPEYAAIVAAFKAGLRAHVEVETAGSMDMSQDISLKGFTRAYGKL
jgi:hypothetical protein